MHTAATVGRVTSSKSSSNPRNLARSVPTRFLTVHEIGRAIHPMLARGQIEGGSVQGLGYALFEQVAMQNGRMANSQLTNYIIPTTLDAPPIEVVMLEKPYAHGPFGAKGVGEMPIDGPAPAVINAIAHAGHRYPRDSRDARKNHGGSIGQVRAGRAGRAGKARKAAARVTCNSS